MSNKNTARKIYVASHDSYSDILRLMGKSLIYHDMNANILLCTEMMNNESKVQVTEYLNSLNVTFFDFAQNSEGNNNFSKIYQICIIKDFENHFNLIPFLIQHIQSNGLVFLISREMEVKSNEIDLSMSSFSKRFYSQLQSKTSCSMITYVNEIIFKDFTKCKVLNQIPDIIVKETFPIELCRTTEQKSALKELIKSFERSFSSSSSQEYLKSSVSIIEGITGCGKASVISLGIASAVKYGLADIYVIGPHSTSLNACCNRLKQALLSMGFDDSVMRVRYMEQYFILEIVADNKAKKIRFINFDQEFSKYDTGLLCILEGGQLSSVKIHRLLSFNPKLIWLSVSTGGYNSTGLNVYDEISYPFRSFSGVLETLPNNVSETVTKSGMIIRDIINKSDHKNFSTIYMSSPVIYGVKDDLELSMNSIFCLQRKSEQKQDKNCDSNFFPEPNDCDMMYVDKRTLFSGQPASEILLENFMSIYTSYDHKRVGSFLKELADDPAHHLFCLQQPCKSGNYVPEIISIAHVSIEHLEHENASTLMSELRKNSTALKDGNGVKIVRLLTQRNFKKLGYGRHMLKMLHKYFAQPPSSSNGDHVLNRPPTVHNSLDMIPIKELPRLLVNINSLAPAPFKIDYLSCQFSANFDLLCFWKKCDFFLAQIKAVSTSEMLCTMIRDCTNTHNNHLGEAVYQEMCENIGQVLLHDLPDVDVTLAHEILFNKNKFNMTSFKEFSLEDLSDCLDSRQLKKLDSFVQNVHTLESIHDIIYYIAQIYFSRRLSGLHLAKYQELALVGFGLQLKSSKKLATELIVMESYKHTNIIDPFNLKKDVQQRIPLLQSHVRECARVFLNHVTKIIDEHDTCEVPKTFDHIIKKLIIIDAKYQLG